MHPISFGRTSSHLLRTALIASGLLPLVASGQRAAGVRTDSVLLARDLDGSGRVDYVVRESKPGTDSPLLRPERVAVYLDRSPDTRHPQWSNAWDAYTNGQGLDEMVSAARGISILAIGEKGGDADVVTLLVVTRGRVRADITHQIDYGDGFFTLRRLGDSVTVDATLSNLGVRGRPVGQTISCREQAEWPAAHLRFDMRARRFVVRRQYCAPRVADPNE